MFYMSAYCSTLGDRCEEDDRTRCKVCQEGMFEADDDERCYGESFENTCNNLRTSLIGIGPNSSKSLGSRA